jgi:hypothetical protein
LDYKLSVFCYFQFLESDPTCRLGVNGELGANGDIGSIQRHPYFQTLVWEDVQQKRVGAFTRVIINVSTTGVVFNFCHKGLSLNLHVKGESNNSVGSTLLQKEENYCVDHTDT